MSVYTALMVGNRSGLGPPSKVFSYMTLPLPRIALVADAGRDETAAYVRSFGSWVVLGTGDPGAPERLAVHIRRRWTETELAPPASEAWPAVVATVDAFLSQIAGRESTPSIARVNSECLNEAMLR